MQTLADWVAKPRTFTTSLNWKTSMDQELDKKAFYKDGITFVIGYDEDKLIVLDDSVGIIVKPLNEVTGVKGISNIRYNPQLWPCGERL